MADLVDRRTYKGHLLYSDPFSKSVASRTTRYRRKRERNEMLSHDDSIALEVTEAETEVHDTSYVTPGAVSKGHGSSGAYFRTAAEQTAAEEVPEPRRLFVTESDSGQEELLTEASYLLEDFYTDCASHVEELYDGNATESSEDEELINDDDGMHTGAEAVLNPSSPNSEEYDRLSSDFEHANNSVLFSGCPISLSSSMILIKKVQMRHKISQEALSDMLELMKLHFPIPNNFPGTLHLFNKELPFNSNDLQFVYFCSYCFGEIAESSAYCIHCDKCLSQKGSISSFIEVPLQSQLVTLLQRKDIYKAIENYPRKKTQDSYCDIKDGLVYQQLVANGFLSKAHNISFQVNTDGVPVFKSSGCSFWPIHLLINELPPSIRSLKENRLIAGIWYGSSKPDMSLFLKPLAETLKLLYSKGVRISIPGKEVFTCCAVLICLTCDMPAKAQVLNITQYNGFYGCSHCKQKGKTEKTGPRGRVQVFPFVLDDPIGPARNSEESKAFARKAVAEGTSEYGVKGPSWLSVVPQFDLIKGVAIDYMHCILLVVTRLLLRLWFQPNHHKEVWYIGLDVNVVDERLCSIRPTKEIQRTPRRIATTVKYWKAHELQMWLLHYSPVVLRGILPDAYYEHHLLLVEGTFLLLKDCITNQDIQYSFSLFKHYCYLFPSFYGERYMTVCLHSLMHLPDCVRNLGPLWSHSCFAFESANGELLKLFSGSTGIEKQIIRHLSELQKMPAYAESMLANDSLEMDFYYRMCSTSKSNKSTILVTESVSILGKPVSIRLDDEEKALLLPVNVNGPVLLFSQILLHKTNRIVMKDTGKTLKNDSCLLYKMDDSVNVGILHKVILYNEDCFILVNRLSVSGEKLCNEQISYLNIDNHIFKCLLRDSTLCVITPQDLIDKCLIMNVNINGNIDSVYVSVFPNCKPLT